MRFRRKPRRPAENGSLRLFQRLQTRLTLSYVGVSVGATILLVLLLISVVGYLVFRAPFYPELVQKDVARIAPSAARRLSVKPFRASDLQQWLEEQYRGVQFPGDRRGELHFDLTVSSQQHLELTVIDPAGRILAASPKGIAPSGSLLLPALPPEERPIVAAALRGVRDQKSLSLRRPGPGNAVAAPIFSTGDKPKLLGVLFVRLITPFSAKVFIKGIFDSIIPAAFVATFFSGITGTVFGYFTARRLTRRISAISAAADGWSGGRFDIQAPEAGNDELSLLSQRLNQMANALSEMLVVRQTLATSEERNRLARDLHDTVKQQVFALALQLAAARSQMNKNPAVAVERLAEAEQLARQAQQELTALLTELRPATPLPFVDQLRSLTSNWSRQCGIPAELDLPETGSPPRLPTGADVTLLRISQEALSNIARHSGATRVEIAFATLPECRRELTIHDNGKGFDTALHRNGGMGLANMEERARSLPGGQFLIDSASGRGTLLRVSFRDATGESNEK